MSRSTGLLVDTMLVHQHIQDYAFKISRLDNTRSIKGRMPSSLDMAEDSYSRYIAFSWSPHTWKT